MMFLLDAFHMAMLIGGVLALVAYAHRHEYNIDVWED